MDRGLSRGALQSWKQKPVASYHCTFSLFNKPKTLQKPNTSRGSAFGSHRYRAEQVQSWILVAVHIHLSSCHPTASNANHFGLEKYALAYEFPVIQCSFVWASNSCRLNFLLVLSHRDNHQKMSYPRMQQRVQGVNWTQIMRSEST